MCLMHDCVIPRFDYTRTAPCIIAETEEWAVVYKPPKLPSAPLHADEPHTAVQWFLQYRPAAGAVCGKKPIEAGLLHRLDTDTRGLILFAKTQAAYHFFTEVQQQDQLIKMYYAFTEPVSAADRTPDHLHTADIHSKNTEAFSLPDFLRNADALPYPIRSQFRNFGPKGKKAAAVFPASRHYSSEKRMYETLIEEACPFGTYFRLRCRLSRGYRHQVRVHLASLGLPIAGDPLYNITSLNTETYPAYRKPANPAHREPHATAYSLQLYAVNISFPTPESPRHRICVALPPPDTMNP